MKKESEKKKPTAIRLSDDERRIVEAKAKAKGMPLSSYITFMAVHGEHGITPEVLVRIQDIVNHALEIIKQSDYHEAALLQMEVNDLWSLLK